jgi:hypothetical protein
VLDFGIAKQNESHGGTGTEITSEGLIVGTPAYMSPEQLSAKPLDERSDVYALALIVFEMLTGRRPFEAKTPLEWATAHISKPVPSFDEFAATRLLPESKRAAILHALAKEPHDRTHSVRAFLEEFLGAQRMSVLSIAPSSDREPRPAGDAPTLAATPSARGARSDAETPRVPTRRTPLVILGAVVMAGVGAALVFAFRDRLVGAPPLTTVSDAGVSVLDAGTDAAVPEPTWLRIMSGSDRTTDVARALGPPDGECARIAPGGKVLLELAPRHAHPHRRSRERRPLGGRGRDVCALPRRRAAGARRGAHAGRRGRGRLGRDRRRSVRARRIPLRAREEPESSWGRLPRRGRDRLGSGVVKRGALARLAIRRREGEGHARSLG